LNMCRHGEWAYSLAPAIMTTSCLKHHSIYLASHTVAYATAVVPPPPPPRRRPHQSQRAAAVTLPYPEHPSPLPPSHDEQRCSDRPVAGAASHATPTPSPAPYWYCCGYHSAQARRPLERGWTTTMMEARLLAGLSPGPPTSSKTNPQRAPVVVVVRGCVGSGQAWAERSRRHPQKLLSTCDRPEKPRTTSCEM
jgi:hypothetical protein